MKTLLLFGFLFASLLPGRADEQPDDAYLKVVTERAAKIVEKLDIDDLATEEQGTIIIAHQYVNLSRIHDERDAAIAAARADAAADKEAIAAAIDAANNAAEAKIYRLNAAFLADLSVELNATEVDGVKNGMTYGVATNTYAVYMKMCPDLSEEQKKRVKAWLLEARELAMDKGSSKAKHGVFGQYKGKINNYLSALGINLKEAEKNLHK